MFYKYILPLTAITLMSSPAIATDTLHLRNGDKLTGTVVSYNTNQVSINTRYGLLAVPMGDVKGVETPNQEMGYAIGQAVRPYSPPPIPAKAAALRPAPQLADSTPASAMAQKAPPSTPKKETATFIGATWSGNANVGAGLRTGNSETSNVNADANLTAKWEKHRAALKADFNREEDEGETTVDNRSLELTHDYFFAPKWFIETSVKFEQDEIDLLDLRTIGAFGLGHQPYDEDDLSLKYVLGPGILDEEFEDGSGDTSLTAQWSLDYSQKFYDDLFRLFHEHDITAPTDDFGAYLFQSESGIRVPIRLGIVASAQVDFDYDNDPAAGTKKEDTIYSLKLGYEWN